MKDVSNNYRLLNVVRLPEAAGLRALSTAIALFPYYRHTVRLVDGRPAKMEVERKNAGKWSSALVGSHYLTQKDNPNYQEVRIQWVVASTDVAVNHLVMYLRVSTRALDSGMLASGCTKVTWSRGRVDLDNPNSALGFFTASVRSGVSAFLADAGFEAEGSEETDSMLERIIALCRKLFREDATSLEMEEALDYGAGSEEYVTPRDLVDGEEDANSALSDEEG